MLALKPVPDVKRVRSWAGVNAQEWPDADVQDIIDGERLAQGKKCGLLSLGDPPEQLDPDLFEALLRRCHRAIAARGVPLGLAGSPEFGQSRLPGNDAEIRRLEGWEEQVVFG